jgi:hypothetical protein
MYKTRIILLGATLLGIGLLIPDSRADRLFLKDGFILRGMVKQDGKTVIDRSGDQPQLEWIPQGFIYMDDGVRRVVFNPQYVVQTEHKKINMDNDVIWDLFIRYVNMLPTPPIIEVLDTTDWDQKWNRVFTYRTFKKEGKEVTEFHMPLKQHLTRLTPDYALTDSTNIRIGLRSHYLTRELGQSKVRELLSFHKDLKDDTALDDEKRITRRFKIYRFLIEAEWLRDAEEELDRIQKDFPKAKERVDEARKNLKGLQALQLYDDIKRAHDAGQYQWVKERFAKLPDSGLPEKMHAEMRALHAEYEAAEANLKLARRYFDELAAALDGKDADLKPVLTEAARSIRDELHLEHFLKSKTELGNSDKEGVRVGRLDTFMSQAQQHERDKKQGGKIEVGSGQVLSLAVTGWLLGGRSAEAKPDFARQLWLARKFVLEYQSTPNGAVRRRRLEQYKQEQSQRNPAISVEEFDQMIPFLPPIEPPTKVTGSEMEFTVRPTRGSRNVNYWVQLPPEYHPGRPWPVLVVLHMAKETPKDALRRWSEQAARNGYIVAAPRWSTAPNSPYEYSVDEHAIVLDLLYDLRRKFQVDSDRVFLTGVGSGGAMAYDVGLAHPDQFAGVIPICGLAGGFGDRYLFNSQYLPMYVVCGDHCNEIHKENRRLIQQWIAKVYPVIYVEYKGRGMEPFAAESDFTFDWMNRKTRANPINEAGAFGREFRMLREEDNRFYWLSTEKINRRSIMPAKWNPGVPEARMCAQVIEGNQIDVKTSGVEQLSVWFGRGLKVDIDKPVMIKWNNALKWQKKVKPDLSILLEDFYERGDRQRLYVARVDMKPN